MTIADKMNGDSKQATTDQMPSTTRKNVTKNKTTECKKNHTHTHTYTVILSISAI